MIVTLILYILIAFWLTRNKRAIIAKQERLIWFCTFAIYALYTVITNQYVNNPSTDYYLFPDQFGFYNRSISLSKLPFDKWWITAATSNVSSDSPLVHVWFACLVKVADFLGVKNILLYMELNNVFLGSLISVIIAKILYFRLSIQPYKKVLLFALISPLFLYSCVLLRDIHICFLYTCMLYVAWKPNLKLRWIWLLLLSLITLYIRTENGLFSVMFWGLAYYRIYLNGGKVRKTIIVMFALFAMAALSRTIISVMVDTTSRYTERTIEKNESTGSIGVKLNYLPIPLNYISKAAFAQMLPFPAWWPLQDSEYTKDISEGFGYKILRSIECLFPFYWLPLLCILFYTWKKYRKLWDKETLALFYICLLYFIVAPASEVSTRRLMAMFPALFIVYEIMRKTFPIRTIRIRTFTISTFILLHVVYMFIKF